MTAVGYRVWPEIPHPEKDDALVIWNRNKSSDKIARRFEAVGARVFVAENGYLGKGWLGAKWYAISENHHNGAGRWVYGGPQRWDGFGIELSPWRDGNEVLILEQRGIGEPGIASPPGWAEKTQKRLGGRIRRHPGNGGEPLKPEDLKNVRCVVTWGSSAALKSLLWGVPVFYEMPKWIGASAAKHISEWGEPRRDDSRLEMFRRLAWAMWELEEIRKGIPFEGARLLPRAGQDS